MMQIIKDEKKLLRYTYLLCLIFFTNLAFMENQFDKGALIIALILCGLLGYAHFIIRRFFPDGDKYILLFSNILALIGIAMLYRLDRMISVKQIVWFTVGVAGFILIVVLFPNLKRFCKYKYFYLVCTLIFMSMGTLFGKEIYGAKNWIVIGGYSFQPSEFAKLTLVAYLAAALQQYGSPTSKKGNSASKINKQRYHNLISLIEPAIVVMISLGFMVLQKDLGSALLFFGISITMLYIATSKFRYVLLCIVLFVLGAVISYKLFNHVRVRVLIWQDPWKFANNEGYQLVQSLISIASGGFFGTGLGLGYPNLVPVVTTDFIYAAICEEMGMLMGFAVMILYFLLFYRCIRAAIYAEDKFSRLLAVGYSTMIASQVLVIVGGVIGAIPLTGITLPLVSYGGSSMIITFFSLGILQKISEEGRSYE